MSRIYTESVAVDPGSWTACVAPFDCDTVTVINNSANSVSVRGRTGQASIPVLAGDQRVFGTTVGRAEQGTRYRRDKPAIELQPTAGVGPIHLVWG